MVRYAASLGEVRILVTGGFGFVGGRLAQLLVQDGHVVVLGSRRAAEAPAWLPDSEVVQMDWLDAGQLRRVCDNVDAVAHLAGMNARECASNPGEALAFNGGATSRLVDAATSAGVERLLYLSTAHVYANPLVGVINEDTRTTSQHPYATSHLAGEIAVRDAHWLRQIEGIVVRLSNTVGAPTHSGVDCGSLLVNDLVRQAGETRAMTLRSTGTQRRDFVALSEACRAIAHLLELRSDLVGEGLFNVGGGWSPTVFEMTQRVADRFEKLQGVSISIPHAYGEVDQQPSMLVYERLRLIESGFAPSGAGAIDDEIDSLIRFCVHATT